MKSLHIIIVIISIMVINSCSDTSITNPCENNLPIYRKGEFSIEDIKVVFKGIHQEKECYGDDSYEWTDTTFFKYQFPLESIYEYHEQGYLDTIYTCEYLRFDRIRSYDDDYFYHSSHQKIEINIDISEKKLSLYSKYGEHKYPSHSTSEKTYTYDIIVLIEDIKFNVDEDNTIHIERFGDSLKENIKNIFHQEKLDDDTYEREENLTDIIDFKKAKIKLILKQ